VLWQRTQAIPPHRYSYVHCDNNSNKSHSHSYSNKGGDIRIKNEDSDPHHLQRLSREYHNACTENIRLSKLIQGRLSRMTTTEKMVMPMTTGIVAMQTNTDEFATTGVVTAAGSSGNDNISIISSLVEFCNDFCVCDSCKGMFHKDYYEALVIRHVPKVDNYNDEDDIHNDVDNDNDDCDLLNNDNALFICIHCWNSRARDQRQQRQRNLDTILQSQLQQKSQLISPVFSEVREQHTRNRSSDLVEDTQEQELCCHRLLSQKENLSIGYVKNKENVNTDQITQQYNLITGTSNTARENKKVIFESARWKARKKVFHHRMTMSSNYEKKRPSTTIKPHHFFPHPCTHPSLSTSKPTTTNDTPVSLHEAKVIKPPHLSTHPSIHTSSTTSTSKPTTNDTPVSLHEAKDIQPRQLSTHPSTHTSSSTSKPTTNDTPVSLHEAKDIPKRLGHEAKTMTNKSSSTIENQKKTKEREISDSWSIGSFSSLKLICTNPIERSRSQRSSVCLTPILDDDDVGDNDNNNNNQARLKTTNTTKKRTNSWSRLGSSSSSICSNSIVESEDFDELSPPLTSCTSTGRRKKRDGKSKIKTSSKSTTDRYSAYGSFSSSTCSTSTTESDSLQSNVTYGANSTVKNPPSKSSSRSSPTKVEHFPFLKKKVRFQILEKVSEHEEGTANDSMLSEHSIDVLNTSTDLLGHDFFGLCKCDYVLDIFDQHKMRYK